MSQQSQLIMWPNQCQHGIRLHKAWFTGGRSLPHPVNLSFVGLIMVCICMCNYFSLSVGWKTHETGYIYTYICMYMLIIVEQNLKCNWNVLLKPMHAWMLSHFSHVPLFLTLWPSLPCSSVHGILQARVLEWVAICSSRWSSWSRDRTHVCCVSCTVGRVFTAEPSGKPWRSPSDWEPNRSCHCRSYKRDCPVPC